MEQKQTPSTSTESIKEYKDIYLLLIKERFEEKPKVICLHMIGIQYSRMIKLAWLRIQIYNFIIKCKNENRNAKLKTICKIANIIRRRWYPTLDLLDLIHKKYKSKREY